MSMAPIALAAELTAFATGSSGSTLSLEVASTTPLGPSMTTLAAVTFTCTWASPWLFGLRTDQVRSTVLGHFRIDFFSHDVHGGLQLLLEDIVDLVPFLELILARPFAPATAKISSGENGQQNGAFPLHERTLIMEWNRSFLPFS